MVLESIVDPDPKFCLFVCFVFQKGTLSAGVTALVRFVSILLLCSSRQYLLVSLPPPHRRDWKFQVVGWRRGIGNKDQKM